MTLPEAYLCSKRSTSSVWLFGCWLFYLVRLFITSKLKSWLPNCAPPVQQYG